jgi:hypothetical protein
MKNLYKIEDELYIISNTENVDENCWIITDGKLVQVSYLLSDEVAKGNKIILTTNKLLINDGVQAIDDEFLEWFVKNPNCEFVEVEEVYPLTCCIQKEGKTKMNNGCMERNRCMNYKIIVPQAEPNIINDWLAENGNPEIEKQVELEAEETLEEIKLPIGDFIIKNATPTQGADGAYYHYSEVCKLLKLQAERMYSEEEVLEFANWCRIQDNKYPNIVITIQQLFTQFKKK